MNNVPSDIDISFSFKNTLRRKLTQNKSKDNVEEKGVYIMPCIDCNKSYVGETGRGLQKRLQEHKRACSIGLQNSAVANHSLNLDHRIDFNSTKIIYHDSDISRRRVVEGAFIHAISTFENNKSFNEEDDIISNIIFRSVSKRRKAAFISADPLLSFAQARDVIATDHRHDAGTDGATAMQEHDNYHEDEIRPQPRRSQRIRNRLRNIQLPGD